MCVQAKDELVVRLHYNLDYKFDRLDIMAKAVSDEVRITSTGNEDVCSSRELLIINLKGVAAYTDHGGL